MKRKAVEWSNLHVWLDVTVEEGKGPHFLNVHYYSKHLI